MGETWSRYHIRSWFGPHVMLEPLVIFFLYQLRRWQECNAFRKHSPGLIASLSMWCVSVFGCCRAVLAWFLWSERSLCLLLPNPLGVCDIIGFMLCPDPIQVCQAAVCVEISAGWRGLISKPWNAAGRIILKSANLWLPYGSSVWGISWPAYWWGFPQWIISFFEICSFLFPNRPLSRSAFWMTPCVADLWSLPAFTTHTPLSPPQSEY